MSTKSENETSVAPSVHSANVQRLLTELIDHTRHDRDLVAEPRLQALLGTSAEVLSGLRIAFERYDKGRETAGKR